VRIVSGVFDGLDGVFVRESGEERVVVLLDLLDAGTPVRLPATCVMPVGRSPAHAAI
jgi:transcription antitermination factor NusG